MSAGTITITAGRAPREGNEQDFQGPDGTYLATLSKVSAPITEPSTMGKGGTWTFRVWTFAIDGGQYDGQVLDVRASVKSSDKSKQYGILTALAGKALAVGTTIDIDRHLVGRQCLIAVRTNENDFPEIASFMAAPSTGPAPAQAPAQPVGALRQQVAADEPLPF